MNQLHAKTRFEISEFEAKLASSKKKKKKQQQATDEMDVEKIKKQIEDLRQALRDLEADWEFDKTVSAQFFAEEQRRASEERQRKEELQRKLRQRRKEQEAQARNGDAALENTNNDAADEYGYERNGLFGGLMIDTRDPAEEAMLDTMLLEQKNDDDHNQSSQEVEPLDALFAENEDEGGLLDGLLLDQEDHTVPAAEQTTTTKTPAVAWTVVEISLKSWKGRLPTDLLQEYGRKHDFPKQKYTKHDLGAKRWRVTVDMIPRQSVDNALAIEMPEGLAVEGARQAEQFAAVT